MSDIARLIDTLPIPAIIISGRGTMRFANKPAEVLFGTTLTDRPYLVHIRNPAVLDCLDMVLRERKPGQTEYKFADAGVDRTLRVTANPVEIDGEEVILVVFEDISSVQHASQIRRDFVANVSHELKSPLTAVLGFLETLQGPAKDDPAARERFLGMLQNEAERMNRLIMDLLSLSRVEAEERVIPRESIDLAEVARTVLDRLEPLALEDGVTIKLDVQGDVPRVRGDVAQLDQVISNLLENAIKYSARPGNVTILFANADDNPVLSGSAIRMEVINDGEGIDAMHIPRLTERFYRVDSHRSREVGGTGLGLAIVKHIITRHRGRMRITSDNKGETRVAIFLPRTLS